MQHVRMRHQPRQVGRPAVRPAPQGAVETRVHQEGVGRVRRVIGDHGQAQPPVGQLPYEFDGQGFGAGGVGGRRLVAVQLDPQLLHRRVVRQLPEQPGRGEAGRTLPLVAREAREVLHDLGCPGRGPQRGEGAVETEDHRVGGAQYRGGVGHCGPCSRTERLGTDRELPADGATGHVVGSEPVHERLPQPPQTLGGEATGRLPHLFPEVAAEKGLRVARALLDQGDRVGHPPDGLTLDHGHERLRRARFAPRLQHRPALGQIDLVVVVGVMPSDGVPLPTGPPVDDRPRQAQRGGEMAGGQGERTQHRRRRGGVAVDEYVPARRVIVVERPERGVEVPVLLQFPPQGRGEGEHAVGTGGDQCRTGPRLVRQFGPALVPHAPRGHHQPGQAGFPEQVPEPTQGGTQQWCRGGGRPHDDGVALVLPEELVGPVRQAGGRQDPGDRPPQGRECVGRLGIHQVETEAGAGVALVRRAGLDGLGGRG